MPPEIGKLTALTMLDLDGNQLPGEQLLPVASKLFRGLETTLATQKPSPEQLAPLSPRLGL